jgi:hypothetical protein
MSIEAQPLDETVVRQLYELACTPFTLSAFEERWKSFGWSHEPDASDCYGFRVDVPGRWDLWVDPLGSEIVCASLPFCYWEDYDPEDHADPAEYRRQRCTYDDAFETAESLAKRVLPRFLQSWTDADENKHRAAVWEGDHGLLVLQQAGFDPQFGIESTSG